jgi:rod shape-determining protein MreD
MVEHSYTSRQELDQYRFHAAVTLLAPLTCVLLQVLLPKLWPGLAILDLPLVATIFFAVARRSPIAGTITGTLIGLFQDGLTNRPFGVYGIAKGLIGYMAASIGFAVDTDNMINRTLMSFGFTLVQSGLVYLITHWLLGDHSFHLDMLHELLRACANTAVAVPLFFLLDRFKLRES